MKIKNLLLSALIAVLSFIPAGRVMAQTFTTLHSFTAILAYTNEWGDVFHLNSDGATPLAGLITDSSGNILYGTAQRGGSFDSGTVFAVNTDGTGFTTLHSFNYVSEGAAPWAGLILSGNTLYGTTTAGGSFGGGSVFAVNTDGTGFTNLHNFTGGSDGGLSFAGLILSGDTLYGTANHGGGSGNGTVFKVNTNGTGFTTLHSFTATSWPDYPYTNSDGANPTARLVISGNTLYGTATLGGSSGNGTVFALYTDGTGFTNLHSFTAVSCCPQTNSDGVGPNGLILSGNTLYGTAQQGGSAGSGYGTVFALNTNGTGFTTLHSFTFSDGAFPPGGLILSGNNTLYGMASQGGSSGNGAVFAINTDGTGFTSLHGYGYSRAGLILSGNTLFGTASQGGSADNGMVFSLSFRPQLTITPSGPYLILTWPDNVAGFDYTGYRLQKANAITGPFAAVPGSSSPYFIPITSPQQFFRLVQ